METEWFRLIQEKSELCGISSAEVKLARDLAVNKRLSGEVDNGDRLFLCEGLWAAEKLCQKGLPIPYFFFCPEAVVTEEEARLACLLASRAHRSLMISEKACRKISERDGADRFFIVASMPVTKLSDLPLSDQLVTIVLDGQEQPGNIGAILRSLDGAGGAFAILTNQRVKLTHSRLIRSSLGAAFWMPVAEAPFDEVTAWLAANDFQIILTDLTASVPYYQLDYRGRVAIVAGNEFQGISSEWRQQKNASPTIIPMLGTCESLNVGFASTLVAYEAGLRQRGLLPRANDALSF